MAPPPLAHRWIYLQTSLWPEAQMSNTVALLERVAGEGYNGILFGDYKFMRWDEVPGEYRAHWRQLRETCTRLHLDLIAAVMPMGYANSLLSRDPNLAEGLPVRDAPLRVRNGALVPDEAVELFNGGFEVSRHNKPDGWDFVDGPGTLTVIDTAVRHGGTASLRMQDVASHEPRHRHARACRTLKLKPFHSYHVSVYVKTQDWDSGDTRIMILGENGAPLNYQDPRICPTQEWTRHDIVFNTLDSATVKLYLGTWAGHTGTIWWDDVRVEPAGFMNVLRRAGTPLRLTGEDGTVVYEEGRDVTPVRDPLLGMDPWAGEYTAWHTLPPVTLPAGSRLKEGDRVLASYYHPAIIHDGQMMCCMAEPAVYEILAQQARQVRDAVHPNGYLMSHDEIRVQGWDESCARTGLAPAGILADNVRRCYDLLRMTDPGKPVYVWSDMFDPYHNAGKSGPYYLVKGDGPWYGAWERLPREITIVNWQMGPQTRRQTMEHFARLGHPQILAGFYDSSPAMITGWLKDSDGIPGINGIMYTTWRADFSQTAEFLKAGQQAR